MEWYFAIARIDESDERFSVVINSIASLYNLSIRCD
ncbi:Uncharacterised protein [Serratia fonticola]|uniref:Uncharacterized protein n=1 Tax=Serratia fonticola TaxID=47917 RepID=A0A4U9WJG4_SERFO|nr:Uncharacterised protein [Serratia fonticola]